MGSQGQLEQGGAEGNQPLTYRSMIHNGTNELYDVPSLMNAPLLGSEKDPGMLMIYHGPGEDQRMMDG